MDILLNGKKSKFFVKVGEYKLLNVSFVSDVELVSGYNLIKMDNRDGFILDDKRSVSEFKRSITFYVDDLKKIKSVFVFNKIVDIFFNSNSFFYRGFVDNIKYSPFVSGYYGVEVSFVLQPYCLQVERSFDSRVNFSIDNVGDFRAFPIVEIYPSANDFSIAINGKRMAFSVNGIRSSKYVVDMDNVEIKDASGNLRNSIFKKDSNFLSLDVGVNSVVLSGVSRVVFRVNWRFMYSDLFKE